MTEESDRLGSGTGETTGRQGGTVPFEKLDGAGNDFVLLRSPLPEPDAATVRFLLDRHHGIGGDGLLHLVSRVGSHGGPPVPSNADAGELDAVVRYWNSDGGFAEYCGNGARCVAAVLLEECAPGAEVRFRLSDVAVRALRVVPGPSQTREDTASSGEEGDTDSQLFAVAHPIPRRLPCPLDIRSLLADLGLIRPPVVFDSGVPHLLLEVSDVRAFDLDRWGAELRHHPSWGAGGTNVDVVGVAREDDLLHVRTWERGVEGETLACGSGLLAVGTWLRAIQGREAVRLESASGARFRVWEEDGAAWLSGPARRVFRGTITIPELRSPSAEPES